MQLHVHVHVYTITFSPSSVPFCIAWSIVVVPEGALIHVHVQPHVLLNAVATHIRTWGEI